MVTWESVTLVRPGTLVGYRMLSVPFVRCDSCNAHVIGNTNQKKIHSNEEQSHCLKRWGIAGNYDSCFWFIEARDKIRKANFRPRGLNRS